MKPSVFGLLVALTLAPAHIYAADRYPTDHQATLTSGDSIRFIVLPYLHAFHIRGHEPTIMLSYTGNRQKLSNDQWRISATSIPAYREESGILQTIDSKQASGPRLSAYGYFIVPLPNHAAPIRVVDLAQKPLWLHIVKVGISRLAWHAPALTPVQAALDIVEQKRKARLAKRMADRAFYFGYDTNSDALK